MDRYLSVRDFFSSTEDPVSSLQKIAPIAEISLEKSKKIKVPDPPFEIVSEGMLRVNVKELLWIRTASLTANRGNLRFARNPGLFNERFGTFLYKAFMGESSFLAVVEGEGIVYLSTGYHRIILIYVNDETINIQGCNILAFENTLKHKIDVMGDLSGLVIGGLSFVNFSGSGWIALAVCGEPVTVESRVEYALETIPARTLAWSVGMQPEVQTDVTRINLMGRGVSDILNMRFVGDGFVTIHNSEEYMYPKIK